VVRTVLAMVGAGALLFSPVLASSIVADQPAGFVIVGCLERAGLERYVVTDHRSGAKFDVHGDNSTAERTLSWQVGHMLEIRGTLDAQSTETRRRVTALSVIEISMTCPQKPAGGH
jgi:hypothetical protein